MSTTTASKKAATDLYQSHDHYLMDELLTEEHRLIRDTARKHVSTHLTFAAFVIAAVVWRRSAPSVRWCPWNMAAWASTRSAMA